MILALIIAVYSVGVPEESRIKPKQPILVEHEVGWVEFGSRGEAELYIKSNGGYIVKDSIRGTYKILFVPKKKEHKQ